MNEYVIVSVILVLFVGLGAWNEVRVRRAIKRYNDRPSGRPEPTLPDPGRATRA